MYVILKSGYPLMLRSKKDNHNYLVNPNALEYIPDDIAKELEGDARVTLVPDKVAKAVIKRAKKLGIPPAKYYLEKKKKGGE